MRRNFVSPACLPAVSKNLCFWLAVPIASGEWEQSSVNANDLCHKEEAQSLCYNGFANRYIAHWDKLG